MTADPNRDPTEANDEDFILEDAPVHDLEDLFQVPPAAGPAQLGAVGAEPGDVLFAEQTASGERLQERPEFAEQGGAAWPGAGMTPADMGVAVPTESAPTDDPLAIDDGVDAEQELQVIDEDAATADVVATGPSLRVRPQVDAPVEEGWEPIAANPGRITDDAIEVPPADEPSTESSEAPAPEFAEPHLVEGEALADAETGLEVADEALPATADDMGQEAPVEGAVAEAEMEAEAEAAGLAAATTESAGRVIGAVRRRNRFAWVPMAAAAALVLGGGAVVMLRPDLIGLNVAPQLVERVQVARPSVELRTPTPPKPVAVAAEAAPVTPAPTAPVGAELQEVPASNLPSPTAVAVEPQTSESTQPTQATQPTEPASAPTATADLGAAAPQPSDDSALLQVGDTLKIGEFEPKVAAAESVWLGVGPGSKAFAQLHNGNFFIGSVKAVAASALVLRVGSGEVTLPRSVVEKVTALGSEEYQQLQKATNGVLRLANQNRLVGTILESVADDHYVLQMHSDRIVVPKQAVQAKVEQSPDQVGFGQNQDEDTWLRQMAERELYPNGAVARSLRSNALPPAPSAYPAKPLPSKTTPAKPTPAKPAATGAARTPTAPKKQS